MTRKMIGPLTEVGKTRQRIGLGAVRMKIKSYLLDTGNHLRVYINEKLQTQAYSAGERCYD